MLGNQLVHWSSSRTAPSPVTSRQRLTFGASEAAAVRSCLNSPSSSPAPVHRGGQGTQVLPSGATCAVSNSCSSEELLTATRTYSRKSRPRRAILSSDDEGHQTQPRLRPSATQLSAALAQPQPATSRADVSTTEREDAWNCQQLHSVEGRGREDNSTSLWPSAAKAAAFSAASSGGDLAGPYGSADAVPRSTKTGIFELTALLGNGGPLPTQSPPGCRPIGLPATARGSSCEGVTSSDDEVPLTFTSRARVLRSRRRILTDDDDHGIEAAGAATRESLTADAGGGTAVQVAPAEGAEAASVQALPEKQQQRHFRQMATEAQMTSSDASGCPRDLITRSARPFSPLEAHHTSLQDTLAAKPVHPPGPQSAAAGNGSSAQSSPSAAPGNGFPGAPGADSSSQGSGPLPGSALPSLAAAAGPAAGEAWLLAKVPRRRAGPRQDCDIVEEALGVAVAAGLTLDDTLVSGDAKASSVNNFSATGAGAPVGSDDLMYDLCTELLLARQLQGMSLGEQAEVASSRGACGEQAAADSPRDAGLQSFEQMEGARRLAARNDREQEYDPEVSPHALPSMTLGASGPPPRANKPQLPEVDVMDLTWLTSGDSDTGDEGPPGDQGITSVSGPGRSRGIDLQSSSTEPWRAVPRPLPSAAWAAAESGDTRLVCANQPSDCAGTPSGSTLSIAMSRSPPSLAGAPPIPPLGHSGQASPSPRAPWRPFATKTGSTRRRAVILDSSSDSGDDCIPQDNAPTTRPVTSMVQPRQGEWTRDSPTTSGAWPRRGLANIVKVPPSTGPSEGADVATSGRAHGRARKGHGRGTELSPGRRRAPPATPVSASQPSTPDRYTGSGRKQHSRRGVGAPAVYELSDGDSSELEIWTKDRPVAATPLPVLPSLLLVTPKPRTGGRRGKSKGDPVPSTPVPVAQPNVHNQPQHQAKPPLSGAQRQSQAVQGQRAFLSERKRVAQQLYHKWNEAVFAGRLPNDLPIVWNSRLASTAGQVVAERESPGSKRRVPARLELSSRIIDTMERLRNTLAHEMCHVAAWHIDHEYDKPHGPAWQAWGRRFCKYDNSLVINRTHDYVTQYRYRWRCSSQGCGKEYGRQRNSIRVGDHVCSLCHAPLLYLGKFDRFGNLETRGAGAGGSPGGTGRVQGTPAKKALNAFASFVKENFSSAQKSLPPKTPCTEVVKLVGEMYRKQKEKAIIAAAAGSRTGTTPGGASPVRRPDLAARSSEKHSEDRLHDHQRARPADDLVVGMMADLTVTDE